MNTKQIEYILELSKTKNFNRAAENMFISQPTMTYQINIAEEEIGFRIFDRSGRGATLTPAGEQFITALRNIDAQLKKAIEQGQNFATKYRDNIRIGLPSRSVLYYLPNIMNQFNEIDPSISITPIFSYTNALDDFLKGESDILFALKDYIKQIPNIKSHDLYESKIYLVCKKDDELANKEIITAKDLKGRTLMVGDVSPIQLKRVQDKVIQSVDIKYFNSPDHDTSLTYVAANRAITLSPGLLNDHHPEFKWIPFDCQETIPCVLCTHSDDKRKVTKDLVTLIKDFYQNNALDL